MVSALRARAAYPRLMLVTAAGFTLLVLAGAVTGFNLVSEADTLLLGIRVGFIGFLLVVCGVAGYVAIRVFRSHPDS